MGSVGATPLLLCLVDLDVRNVEGIDIQTFHLEQGGHSQKREKRVGINKPQNVNRERMYFGIALGILKQIQNKLG